MYTLSPYLLLFSFFICTIQGIDTRRTSDPLNVQGAVDLDEMDIDLSNPEEQKTPPSSMEISGDVTVLPVSSTPIDMSVMPEPVPKVDAVEPPSLPSYGGIESMRVIGQHFGTEKDLDQTVVINGQACKETKWISVTVLECVGPPSFTVGTVANVQVNVARSSSDPSVDGITVEYEPPIIQRIIPSVGPTHGNTLIRILGRHFGDVNVANANDPVVAIGNLPCTRPILINSTEIQCTTLRLDQTPGPFVVSIITDGVSSNVTAPTVGSNVFTYALPTIHNIEPPVGPTFGVTRVTLHGTGFGEATETFVKRVVVIGSRMCENVQIINDEELSCELPPSTGGVPTPDGVEVTLLVDSQQATTPNNRPLLFRYVEMKIMTTGILSKIQQNVDGADYDPPNVMLKTQLMIEGDQLAPWNVRPEACANRADLQDCGKDCLLSSHVDVLEKEKCTSTHPKCNGGGRYTCVCKHPLFGHDTAKNIVSRPQCKVVAERVPTVTFVNREHERKDLKCPRVEVINANKLICHLEKDNSLGGPMNITVSRNNGLGIATKNMEFYQRPVITGVKASEDFQGGPLTLTGFWLGNNEDNLLTVMIGAKKCLDVKRK